MQAVREFFVYFSSPEIETVNSAVSQSHHGNQSEAYSLKSSALQFRTLALIAVRRPAISVALGIEDRVFNALANSGQHLDCLHR